MKNRKPCALKTPQTCSWLNIIFLLLQFLVCVCKLLNVFFHNFLFFILTQKERDNKKEEKKREKDTDKGNKPAVFEKVIELITDQIDWIHNLLIVYEPIDGILRTSGACCWTKREILYRYFCCIFLDFEFVRFEQIWDFENQINQTVFTVQWP